MKTSNYQGVRRIPFVLCIVLLSLIFSGCAIFRDNEVDTRKKRTPAIPISIQFLNADSDSDVEPQKVTIEIYDPNRKVFTPIGNQSSSYTIENGFLSLVVRGSKNLNVRRERPTALPYRFTIKSRSNGYLEKTQTIVIDELSGIYVPVFMMPLENMPPGSSLRRESKALMGEARLKNDVNINTKPSPNSGENGITARLIIEKGTQLYRNCKKNGKHKGCWLHKKDRFCKKPITDPANKVRIDFYQFDPRSEASANAFPNGFLVTDAVDKQGESLATLEESFFFSSLGYFNLSMTVGEEEVAGFSKPVTMEMEVPDDLISSVTGSPIEEGYKVPLWSLNANTGQWTKEEASVALNRRDDRLFVKFKMTHLSTWNLDDIVNPCPLPPVTIKINNSGSFQARYAGLFPDPSLTATPFGIGGNISNVLLLKGGEHTLKIKRVPMGTAGREMFPHQFRLYNSARKSSGIALTQSIDSCGQTTQEINLSGGPLGCVQFEIKIPVNDDETGIVYVCPTLTALWYQRQVSGGADGEEVQYNYPTIADVITNGKVLLDMNGMIPEGTAEGDILTYKFSFQVTSGEVYSFVILYKVEDAVWERHSGSVEEIEYNVNSIENLETPMAGCSNSYRIFLKSPCCVGCMGDCAKAPSTDGPFRECDVPM